MSENANSSKSEFRTSNSSSINNENNRADDQNERNGETNTEEVFQIAIKAEKLLQEILSMNGSGKEKILGAMVKQEPTTRGDAEAYTSAPAVSAEPVQQHTQAQHGNLMLSNNVVNNYQPQMQHHAPPGYSVPYQANYYPAASYRYAPVPPQYVYPTHGPGPGPSGGLVQATTPTSPPNYYIHHPPPVIAHQAANSPVLTHPSGHYYYPRPLAQPTATFVNQQPVPGVYYAAANPVQFYNRAPANGVNITPPGYVQPSPYGQYSPYASGYNGNGAHLRKRKFGEISRDADVIPRFNYNSNYPRTPVNSYASSVNSNGHNDNDSTSANSARLGSNASTVSTSTSAPPGVDSSTTSSSPSSSSAFASAYNELEEEDLNIMREKELKDLKCKSVVEKMSVFLKYYRQFRDAYVQRVQSIECSDSLKMQFNSLIKCLNEYEQYLLELNALITEHEREGCKNNHRKTKKFFNKSKAFIRYECSKRLQTNIFEYRRLINSQNRYAGMYELIEMNNYLISLLPDIGVSIRRYINRCEKAKAQEQQEEEDYVNWHSENSNDSTNETTSQQQSNKADDLINIPTFKEFVNRMESGETLLDESTVDEPTSSSGDKREPSRTYESFSKGIDSLNRYLLKRVEDEQTVDELVKERIIKWINKRQAKYILIFSDVDKLLNQHKAGECYSKFHSYLLFNIGKLITVCDSYHQKLKELLYSTTIRRKKKRKKVKILPEAMTDVFNQISDLKRALEHAKLMIKRCNELKSISTSSLPKAS